MLAFMSVVRVEAPVRPSTLLLASLVAACTAGPSAPAPAEPVARVEAPAPPAAAKRSPPPLTEQRREQVVASRTASVAGKVRGPDGAAVAGATVCARASSRHLATAETRDIPCTTSGADGRYHITSLYGVRHRVGASAPNLAPADHDPPGSPGWIDLAADEQRSGVDIDLLPAGNLFTGRIVDPKKRPCADAQVSFEPPGQWPGAGAVTRTDAKGEFSLWLSATSEGKVRVSHPGRADAVDRRTGGLVTQFLHPEGRVQGTVTNRDGPVVGARISLESTEVGRDSRVAFTDAQGRYEIDRLPDPLTWAQYGIVASHGDTVASEGPFDVPHGEITTKDLVLGPATVLRGHVVVDETGAACSAGIIELRGHDVVTLRVPLAADGAFAVYATSDPPHDLRAHCPGFASLAATPVDASKASVQLRVTRGRSVRGRVLTSQGTPAALVSVSAVPVAHDAAHPGQQTMSERDGTFVLTGLHPGPHDLRIDSVYNSWETTPADGPLRVEVPTDRDIDGIDLQLVHATNPNP